MEEQGMKTCPRCGARLFEDMDVCYGCLYNFSQAADEGAPADASGMVYGGDRSVAPSGSVVPEMRVIGAETRGQPAPSETAPDARAPQREAMPDAGERPASVKGSRLHAEPQPATLSAERLVQARGDRCHEIWGSLDEVWDEPAMHGAGGADARALKGRSMRGLPDVVTLAGNAALGRGAETGPATGARAVAVPITNARGRSADASSTAEIAVRRETTRLCALGVPESAVWVRVLAGGIEATCVVPASGLSVGRDADNDVSVGSRAVSRHHVRIVPTEKGVFAQDLGATNPALVNGKILSGGVPLRIGDLLELRGAGVAIRLVAC